MTAIITRAGSGAALTQTENDDNLDSLSGINVVDATTSVDLDEAYQNDTIELTNAGAIAVTLELLSTIIAALDTTDFTVTVINTGAGTATITPNVADSINTGAATIVLKTDEYVTLQSSDTSTMWNIINSSTPNNPISDVNGNEVLGFIATGSAITYARIANNTTGQSPYITPGGEADIGFVINDSNGNPILQLTSTPSAANNVVIDNAATGDAAVISTSETNTNLQIAGNGTGSVITPTTLLDANGNEWVTHVATGSAANNVRLTSATTGNAALIDTTETNTDLALAGNGTGDVTINSKPVYGMVVLDAADVLVTSSAAVGTWTQYDMSAGTAAAQAAATAGATKAILRINMVGSYGSGSAPLIAYIQKNGEGGATDDTNMVSRMYAINGTDSVISEVVVNLDANSDFEYQMAASATSNSISILLVGYYV